MPSLPYVGAVAHNRSAVGGRVQARGVVEGHQEIVHAQGAPAVSDVGHLRQARARAHVGAVDL